MRNFLTALMFAAGVLFVVCCVGAMSGARDPGLMFIIGLIGGITSLGAALSRSEHTRWLGVLLFVVAALVAGFVLSGQKFRPGG